MSIWVSASAQSTLNVQQRLESLYPLTRTSYDKAEIVSAGAVLTLKKDNLKMVPASSADVFQNTYQQGRILQNALGKAADAGDRVKKVCGLLGALCPSGAALPAGPAARMFMSGEKMWVTQINVSDNSVAFELLTDPDSNNVRYRASLTFRPVTQAEQAAAEVFSSEIFSTQLPDNTPQTPAAVYAPPPPADGNRAGSDAAAASDTVALARAIADRYRNGLPEFPPGAQTPGGEREQAVIPPPPPRPEVPELAIIPPPPPPVATGQIAQTKASIRRIIVGQTNDQMKAIFGQPSAINIPSPDSELYIYGNLKIWFVNHRVVDAQ